ncbi:MAG: MFS transporter, partial [Syntrophomonas sp.]
MEPKLWTKEYIFTTFINFFTALNFYLLMIVVSKYAMNKFDSSPSEAGLTVSIFIVGALIMRLLTGKLITRIGYKKVLCAGVIANLTMTLLYFEVNSLFFLLFIRFLNGAAFGITTTATATIIADIVPQERTGEGIGYFSLSQTLATAIGPFLGMFLSQHGSYSMIFTACAVAALFCIVLAPFLSLRKMELTEEQLREMQERKLSNLIEFGVIPISIIVLLIYLCYSSIVSFLAVYAQEIHLVYAASFFFIIYALVVLISRPTVGRFFDLKGENSIMYLAILIYAIGMFLFSHSYHGYQLLLAAVLVGLGVGAIQSSTMAIVAKITPQYRLGVANGTYFMLADLGMGVGPLLVGCLIPFIGYRGMYTSISVMILACLFLYYLLHGRKAKPGEKVIIKSEHLM